MAASAAKYGVAEAAATAMAGAQQGLWAGPGRDAFSIFPFFY